MVCNRCIMAVKQATDKLNIPVSEVSMGELNLTHPLPPEKEKQLQEELITLGFEILDNQKKQLIEKIKHYIIESIHHSDSDKKHNLSTLLTQKLQKDYSYLSHLFSEVEGTTIEKYAILHKIEKAKELIIYDELTLSEIAYKLGYSSVAHLSAQFKKITGLTPSHFKQVGLNKRKPLDQV